MNFETRNPRKGRQGDPPPPQLRRDRLSRCDWKTEVKRARQSQSAAVVALQLRCGLTAIPGIGSSSPRDEPASLQRLEWNWRSCSFPWRRIGAHCFPDDARTATDHGTTTLSLAPKHLVQ